VHNSVVALVGLAVSAGVFRFPRLFPFVSLLSLRLVIDAPVVVEPQANQQQRG
jgi:hypothetical protein